VRILQPEVKDTLSEILHFDHAFTKEGEAVYKYFHTYVVDFQKNYRLLEVQTQKISNSQTVKLAMQQLIQVTEQINSAKRILREFASSNLTIDDFLDNSSRIYKRWLTKRAPDKWESARLRAFSGLSFSTSQTLSTPPTCGNATVSPP